MQIDIKTSTVQQVRQTFSHVARRLGADKPASRYQEATLELQPEVNFHYRPLWEPEFEIYDKGRTAIVMSDWYAFKDPRQYYYGTYTMVGAGDPERLIGAGVAQNFLSFLGVQPVADIHREQPELVEIARVERRQHGIGNARWRSAVAGRHDEAWCTILVPHALEMLA